MPGQGSPPRNVLDASMVQLFCPTQRARTTAGAVTDWHDGSSVKLVAQVPDTLPYAANFALENVPVPQESFSVCDASPLTLPHLTEGGRVGEGVDVADGVGTLQPLSETARDFNSP